MQEYNVIIPEQKKQLYSGHLKLGGTNPAGESIGYTNYYMTKDGLPYFPICGEFHYSRYPCLDWEEELLKIKACGVNIVSTYIFWNHHEEIEGTFNWDGNRNIRYFIELCLKHGLKVILRIGPFSHGEARNGGFPDWLYGRPFMVRSNDEGYLYYVRRFFNEIGRQVSGLLFKDNGPIIGIQLENEHMHASPPWEFMVVKELEWVGIGRDGVDHIRTLKTLAQEAGLVVPLYTCTGWGGASFIEDETLPLYGGYAFQPWQLVYSNQPEHLPTNEYLIQDFHNKHFHCVEFKPPYDPEKYPYACCELGGGMACWYLYRFVVEPESVEAATIARIAGGCNFIGYYMFHDGSNPVGLTGYLNERVVPKISYDFQAPIGEFGQIRTSYQYLKLIFMFLEQFGGQLCKMGTTVPGEMENLLPANTETLRYAVRSGDQGGFVFLINYQDHVQAKPHEEVSIEIVLPKNSCEPGKAGTDETGTDKAEAGELGADAVSLRCGSESLPDKPDRTLRIPAQGGFTLDRNVSAILPFHLELDGLVIEYATAQLITGIPSGLDGSDDRTYFLFAHDRMRCEYCLDAASITEIEANDCSIRREGGRIYAEANPGMNCNIHVTTRSGRKVTLCTLNREQALNIWKYELCGRERIILSEACLTVKNGLLEATNIGGNKFSISVYPAVTQGLAPAGGVQNGGLPKIHKTGVKGIFETYQVVLPKKVIITDVTNVSDGKAVVRIAQDVLEGLNEVYLRIDYFGSIGNAFINGKLIGDNFFNGEVWEIGVKRHMPELAEKGVYFHIIPYSAQSSVIFDKDIQFRHKRDENKGAEIYSIHAVPEYKAVIQGGPF